MGKMKGVWGGVGPSCNLGFGCQLQWHVTFASFRPYWFLTLHEKVLLAGLCTKFAVVITFMMIVTKEERGAEGNTIMHVLFISLADNDPELIIYHVIVLLVFE